MFTCMTTQYFTVMLCRTWARFIPNAAFTMKLTCWIVDQLAFVEHLGIFLIAVEVAGLTSGWFCSPSRTSYCRQRHCHMFTRGEQWTAWISLSRCSALFCFFSWLIWRGIPRSFWSFGARIASVAAYYGQRCPDWNQFLAMTNSSGLNFQCHAWTLTIFWNLLFRQLSGRAAPEKVVENSFWKIFVASNVCDSNPCWPLGLVFIPKAPSLWSLNNLRLCWHQASSCHIHRFVHSMQHHFAVAHSALSAGHGNSAEAVGGS